MRVFLLLALLAPIMALEVKVLEPNPLLVAQSRIMEDKIIAFLECLREILKNGDAETGFPSFNPLEVPDLTLNLDNLNLQGVNGQVTVKNFHLAGLPDWSLDKLKISVTIIPLGAKLVVDVQWPAGDVSGEYDADVTIFDHTIKGAGKIDGALAKLRFEVEGQAGINPIAIKSAKAKASLESSRLVVENLTVDGTDVSGPLSELAQNLPQLLKDNEAKVNQVLKDVVIPAINKILAGSGGDGGSLPPLDELPVIGKCFPPKMRI